MHEPAKPWPTIRTLRSDKCGFRAMLHLELPPRTLLCRGAGVNLLRGRFRCSRGLVNFAECAVDTDFWDGPPQ